MAKGVELGFLEKAECPEELSSACFPSKVGGKPAWLDPTCLPTPEETACSVCGVPRTFLLQVYAPLPDIPSAFHRSFFLFMCLNSSCHQRNSSRGFRVFRCQLPKLNRIYDEESSEDERELGCSEESDLARHESGKEEGTETVNNSQSETKSCDCGDCEAETSWSTMDKSSSLHEQQENIEPTVLCIVCGSAGPKKCSRCKMVHYCSKHHQTHDWKHGHKLFCSDLMSAKCRLSGLTYDPSYGVCLPEFVLVTEEEPTVEGVDKGKEERGEEERMRDYHDFVKSGKYHDHSSKGGKKVRSVMEKAESGSTSDKVFRAFKRRVALEPEQVIRYQRGSLPLLVSRDSAPQAKDVPPCVCGADRQFEFQVMPQLLYYLKLDAVSEASVDWGTLLIHSCSVSCITTDTVQCRYTTDVVLKQDFSVAVKH